MVWQEEERVVSEIDRSFSARPFGASPRESENESGRRKRRKQQRQCNTPNNVMGDTWKLLTRSRSKVLHN
jgi:hypothetical protein